jgi:type I restriction enzyme, S subunit
MSTALHRKPVEASDLTAESDLPEGWARPSLREMLTVNYGKGLKESYRTPGSVLVYGSNGAVGSHQVPLTNGPTVIIGRKGTIGAVHFCPQACWPIDTTYYVDDFHDLDPMYFTLALQNLGLGEFDTSTAIPGLNRDDLYDQTLALAPQEEQRRIVSKVEEVLAQAKAVRARLAKGAQILKRFRQSVLAAACSGRLTEDWRNDDANDGDLPKAWRWQPVGELLTKSGIFDGPFGSNLKTSDYTPDGIRVIRMENIGWLSFAGSKRAFISQKKYETLTRHTVEQGDVIFSSFVDDEIRSCVLPALPTKAIAKADCFCLRPDARLVDRHYLVLQLSSQESYDALREDIHGATRPRVNTTQVKKLLVRVCPISEQKEIVRRVQALFKLADTTEQRVEAARERANRLTQSILAKAFRGELVPTEAELARRDGRSYETAAELLARIKAERTVTHAVPKSPHRSNRARTVRG